MHTNIQQYLQSAGLSDKETQIWLTSYQIGASPASEIARHAKIERTLTYKLLLKLVQLGLMSQSQKGHIKHFWVAHVDVLQHYITQRLESAQSLQQQLPDIIHQVQALQGPKYSFAPKTRIYDGHYGIGQIYEDMLAEVNHHQYRLVKLFTSNTVNSYGLTNKTMQDYYGPMVQKLKQGSISVDVLMGNGIELIDNLTVGHVLDDVLNIPATYHAINIWLVGQSVYIIIYEQIPYGIQISSDILANCLHFIFDQLSQAPSSS